METQLLDGYMAGSGAAEGIYLVAICSDQPGLIDRLANRARALTRTRGKSITVLALDCRLPERAPSSGSRSGDSG